MAILFQRPLAVAGINGKLLFILFKHKNCCLNTPVYLVCTIIAHHFCSAPGDVILITLFSCTDYFVLQFADRKGNTCVDVVAVIDGMIILQHGIKTS